MRNDIFTAVSVEVPDRFSHLEIVATDIVNTACKLRIFTCYRPPSGDADPAAMQYIKDMCDCLDSLYPVNSTVVVCGDFNLPSIAWSNIDITVLSKNSCSGIFLNFTLNHALYQHVSDYTRFNSNNNSATVLDLVLCNDANFIYDVCVLSPFSTSDHCTVSFKIINSSVDSLNKMCSRDTFDFNRADWPSIFEYLNNCDLDEHVLNCIDVASKIECFYSIVNECFTKFIPVVSNKSTSKYTVYPCHIRRHLKRKAAAWRVYKHFRTQSSLDSYKLLASECRSLIYKFNIARERKIINSENISSFYRHCNRRFNSRSVIGPIRTASGSLTTDAQTKANIFQHCFSSYFTVDNNVLPPINVTSSTNSLKEIIFGPGLVNKAIKKLKSKAKGGPDGIPPLFFKKCKLWVSPVLSNIFQSCFEAGFMPSIWLKAFITPIFKKGNKLDPCNYRPIALTCVMCKLMESVVKDQLLSYLLCHKLISKHQHAFILHHSTTTNLLECTLDWSVSLNNKHCVDVIYIDFQRAFDSIVHSKLILKLQSFGISGKLLVWLTAFLSNRTQCVAIENCLSDEKCVLSGIPQGSVIGPILFLLFINDVDSVCSGTTNFKLFADDLKLYSNVTCPSSSNTDLQHSLDNLLLWANTWQLTINTNKCSVLGLHGRFPSSNNSYFLHNCPLTSSNPIRDLGILINNNLSYKSHINSIVSKSLQRVGILFRGFLCRDLHFLRKAFITYVRPLIEYNSILWSPNQKKYIDLIEKVQRRFTKRIPHLHKLPYLDRLKTINLPSLELRRLHFDLFYYYKILHNLTDINPNNFFTYHNPLSSLRQNLPIVTTPLSSTSKYLSTLPFRSLSCWNFLPPILYVIKRLLFLSN